MTVRRYLPLLPVCALVLCLFFQKEAAKGVAKGLEIALHSALPSLFPSLALSGLIVRSLPQARGKGRLFLPFFLGHFCGFPVGAKCCADLFRRGILSEKEARRLLFSCGGCSPAFLTGVIGQGVFQDPVTGWILWGAQVAVGAFLYLFAGLFRRGKSEPGFRIGKEAPEPFFLLFVQATGEAMLSFLSIASFLLFFSFFTRLILVLFSVDSPVLTASFSLFFELCGGADALKALPRAVSLPLAAAGIGWSGVSALFQVKASLGKTGLLFRDYLSGRSASAVLLSLFAVFFKNLL